MFSAMINTIFLDQMIPSSLQSEPNYVLHYFSIFTHCHIGRLAYALAAGCP